MVKCHTVNQNELYFCQFQQKPCSVPGCAIQTTNLGQHLVKFHHVDKDGCKYAELMKDSSKRTRTTYSKCNLRVYAF